MPGCNCGGSSCSCLVEPGPGITVTGVGSADRPYTISVAAAYRNEDVSGSSYVVGGATGGVQPRTVESLDFLSPSGGTITLPGEGVPLPPLGSEILLDINGHPGAAITFTNTIGWRGGQPGAEKRGLYRFTLVSDSSSGPLWLGEYVGL